MSKTYQITEYGSFVSGETIPGCVTLPASAFEQLENFVLSNRNRDTDALELMGLSARKGVGKIITAKNYIGIIALNNGTTFEILPKVHSRLNCNSGDVKKLVVKMLKTLRESPYKSLQTLRVSVEKMPLFEIFIRMFIDEVFAIVKRGLKRNYESVRSNESVIKGKIVFSEHIKRNFAHKERSFVEYDEYNYNRPENRLIKATLQYLYRSTASIKNKADLKTLLNAFAEVDTAVDYNGDFTNKSFTSFAGTEVAYALLFPMETLFESYIAAKLKKILPTGSFQVSAQDRRYHLFDMPKKQFLMKPDIVVTRRADGAIYVMDTKWKLLSGSKAHYGISQSDMYQMYAYQKSTALSQLRCSIP